MILDIFRFVFFAVFTGLHCALMAGLFREWRRDRRWAEITKAAHGEPLVSEVRQVSEVRVPETRRMPETPVSVVIPLHNEASRLGGLLETLARQDYPNAEFVFIDDRSTDASASMIRAFAEGQDRVVLITLGENPGPNRKQYALCRGIEAASGDLLLFTDADCELRSGWIRAMATRMTDPQVGISIGPVFKKGEGRGFFHRYQCFDHAVRYLYLAASTGLGAAGGGFGNNLIVRREALEAIGGYRRVPPSPTEDAALISLVRGTTNYRVHAACAQDVWVFTAGERGWMNLINQTLRWNNGGLFSPDPVTRLNFSFLMITISLGILALPLLPFFPVLWPLSAAVLISMTGNTLAIMGLFAPALPLDRLRYAFQVVVTPAYFTLLTILGFLGFKPRWKGVRS